MANLSTEHANIPLGMLNLACAGFLIAAYESPPSKKGKFSAKLLPAEPTEYPPAEEMPEAYKNLSAEDIAFFRAHSPELVEKWNLETPAEKLNREAYVKLTAKPPRKSDMGIYPHEKIFGSALRKPEKTEREKINERRRNQYLRTLNETERAQVELDDAARILRERGEYDVDPANFYDTEELAQHLAENPTDVSWIFNSGQDYD